MKITLWNNNIEKEFFRKSLESFSTREQLFYHVDDEYYAYIPKGSKLEGQTLQSRNSLIGQFTEKWCRELFNPIAKKIGLYAINGVVCNEIGLTRSSSADLAFCAKDSIEQKPEDIKLIFEVKMSIVSNYKLIQSGTIKYVGDYTEHKGNPSLLRSDSMLKAIGKSINIRVSGSKGATIPILILGNSPITKNYEKKVDYLRKSGVIQSFLSLNPNPTSKEYISSTSGNGFITINNGKQLFDICNNLVSNEYYYFSSMKSKIELGKIISLANQEKDEIAIAEKFLQLINE